MVGVDLLLARLNHWESHVASASEDTSFSAELAPISALAARWRRLQLAGWARVIDGALAADRAAVFGQWHRLFGVFFGGAPPENVLPVLEEFLQSATLGQFAARLDLLAVFRGHCGILGAGDPENADVSGWRRLEVAVGNVLAYYGQHRDAVQNELKRVLSPIQKELKVCCCPAFYMRHRWLQWLRSTLQMAP